MPEKVTLVDHQHAEDPVGVCALERGRICPRQLHHTSSAHTEDDREAMNIPQPEIARLTMHRHSLLKRIRQPIG